MLKLNNIGCEEDYKFVKCRVGWRGSFRDVDRSKAHFTLHVTRDDCEITEMDSAKPISCSKTFDANNKRI